jgi:hypothetical protein
MPNLKFPPSVEIKRAIAAAQNAGIAISLIEIHPRKIVIYASGRGDDQAPEISAYEVWKMSQGKDTSRIGQSVEKTDALQRKSRR